MRQKTGFPRPYLVTSAPERAESAQRDQIARRAIERIETCREELIAGGYDAAVKILDIALLELSISLNGITCDELRSITDALHADAVLSSGNCEDTA